MHSNTSHTRTRGKWPRWLWRIVGLFFRRKLRLELRAKLADQRREYAEYRESMMREDVERTCEWAADERAQNWTLRRLLARHHEASTLALSGYAGSELSTETAAALDKPNAGHEPRP